MICTKQLISHPHRPPTPFTLAGCVLLAALTIAGCDQDPDESPQAVGRIEALMLTEGRTEQVDVSSHFRDPEGRGLTFRASSSSLDVASAATTGSVATISALAPGVATILITATDPGGNSAEQSFDVTVAAAPVIELAATHSEAPESGDIMLALALSAPPALPISVSYTLGRDTDETTADADARDFAGGSLTGALEIAAGATEATISIELVDDSEIEPAREFFTLTLNTPSAGAGYKLGTSIRGTGAIAEGVCDRTPVVQSAIIAAVEERADCTAIQDKDLEQVQFLVVAPPQASIDRQSWRSDPISPPGFCEGDFMDSPRLTSGWLMPGQQATCPSGSPFPNHTMFAGARGTSAGTTLKPDDFSGFGNLFGLFIVNLGLESLPADIFAHLDRLYQLVLIRNSLSTLPANLFANLETLGSLIMQENGLTELPDGIFNGLGALEELNLDRNRLTSLPEGLATLTNLNTFSAIGNRLQTLPAQGPSGLFGLYLGRNGIAEIPTGWLAANKELREIDLHQNNIATISAESFPALPNLASLYLYENRIESIAPGTLANLTGLRVLILAQNRIHTLPEGALAGPDSLRWLALDENRIESLDGKAFAETKGLEQLWVSSNMIEAIDPDIFAGLSNLQLLSFANNHLNTLPDNLFADLKMLRATSFAKNRIASLPTKMLAQLQALDVLLLSDNRIEELPEGFFLGHPGLEDLDFTGNPGAPFPLVLSVARIDNENALAPGPATIAARMPMGAPFDLALPMTIHGGNASAEVLQIGAGSEFSEEETVTLEPGAMGTQVSPGPRPRIASGFAGLDLVIGQPVVLFGERDNHAPVAVRPIATHRLRLTNPDRSFAGAQHFQDLDDDPLEYSFVLSNPGVASLNATDAHIAIRAVEPGDTDVTVTATDPEGLSASLSFSILVRGFVPGSYDLELILIDSMSTELEGIFQDAAEWWMTILGGSDLPSVPTGHLSQLGCGSIVTDQTSASIDDLLVVVATPEIDGRGGILAVAAPCAVREESLIPFMGVVQFDLDDLNGLVSQGMNNEVEEVILHELGHVLGIGTLWEAKGFLQNPSLAGASDADTHFSGPLAIEAFNAAGGDSYPAAKVPVENRAGPGRVRATPTGASR